MFVSKLIGCNCRVTVVNRSHTQYCCGCSNLIVTNSILATAQRMLASRICTVPHYRTQPCATAKFTSNLTLNTVLS